MSADQESRPYKVTPLMRADAVKQRILTQDSKPEGLKMLHILSSLLCVCVCVSLLYGDNKEKGTQI